MTEHPRLLQAATFVVATLSLLLCACSAKRDSGGAHGEPSGSKAEDSNGVASRRELAVRHARGTL